MSQYIAYAQGASGMVTTRIGSKTTGCTASVNGWDIVKGWDIGAGVSIRHIDDEDVVSISLDSGSGNKHFSIRVISITQSKIDKLRTGELKLNVSLVKV